MNKLFPLFFLLWGPCFAEKLSTPLRAGVGLEAFGIAPKVQLYAESFFSYKTRAFWNVQAGVGLLNAKGTLTYSFSGALTYSYLLNPYRRTQCNPVPGHRRFKTYLEGGIASFFSDTRFNEPIFHISKGGRQPLFTPLVLAGLRLHYVTDRRIYILKFRYTPILMKSKYASMAGVALGFGWR